MNLRRRAAIDEYRIVPESYYAEPRPFGDGKMSIGTHFSHAIRRPNGELVFRATTSDNAAQLLRRLENRHSIYAKMPQA